MATITQNKPSSFSMRGSAKKIILGIFVVIIAAIVLAVVFTKGISDTAKNELIAIKAGNYEQAYSMTSKAFQQETPMDKFKEFIGKYPILKDYKDVSFDERKVENGFGYLHGTIEGLNGSKMIIEFQLVKEDDGWKVQALRLTTGMTS
jgi:hypothetical protein